jgi:small subunit ribosomal protein S4
MLQIKSKYKVCKRLGSSVFEQCQNQKFTLSEARSKKMGGNRRRRNVSDYGKQLLEKQKMRFTYGLSERQLVNYVKEANLMPEPRLALNKLLECRFDNVIYRMNLAPTRRAARQMSSHGNIKINGKKTTIPSRQISVGDTIEVRDESKDSPLFADIRRGEGTGSVPNWLVFDAKNLSGQVKGEPSYSAGDTLLDYSAVFEYYSR